MHLFIIIINYFVHQGLESGDYFLLLPSCAVLHLFKQFFLALIFVFCEFIFLCLK